MKDTKSIVLTGFSKRKRRILCVTVILTILVLTLMILSLMSGNTSYSIKTIISVVLGETIKGATFAIHTIRMPRMLAGLLAGFAFGMAGNTFQTMLRNPLASPDVIGVTAGSSMAAIFCMLVLHMSGSMVSFIAVISGLAVALVIYMLSNGGSFSGGRMILIGIGIQAMINAVISYLLLRANQYDVPAAMRWLSGSLNGIQMSNIYGLALVTIVGSLCIIGFGKPLKMLELGEMAATSLGVKTERTRLILVISAVFLIAFATSVTGPISFVAFLAGPIASRINGYGSQGKLTPGLVGAILVLLADSIGQFAFDTRFPVGVITGILGAPYLLFLLIQMNRRGGAA